MPTICTVADFKSTAISINISFHRFPVKNVDLCKRWMNSGSSKDKINLPNARVCSVHFREIDFEWDLKGELLGTPCMQKLIPSVYPSVFPSRNLLSFSNKENVIPRDQRAPKKAQKELIDEILTTHSQPVGPEISFPKVADAASQTVLYVES